MKYLEGDLQWLRSVPIKEPSWVPETVLIGAGIGFAIFAALAYSGLI